MDNVGLDCKILLNEVRRVSVISNDSADFCRREKYILGLLPGEKLLRPDLVRQIQLIVTAGDDILVACQVQTTNNRRPCQAPVTGNVYSGLRKHHYSW